MAQPTTVKSGSFRVYLGDSASPIVYTAPCGFTSKSLTLTKNLNEINIPDCDDPDAVAWVGRDAATLSMSVTGEGVLASESVEAWLDAWEDDESVPVKVELVFPAKTITWTGLMHIATFTSGAEQGSRATANVEMQSDGEMTRVVTP